MTATGRYLDVRGALAEAGIEALEEPTQLRVLLAQLGGHPATFRPEIVPGTIRASPVAHNQLRSLARWQLQPGQYLIHLLGFRPVTVEWADPVTRALAMPVGLGAHPEVGGRWNPLALRGNPQRLCLEPVGIAAIEVRTLLPIEEAVVDDAVRVRERPGGDGHVPGEGIGRKDRRHPLGAYAFRRHPGERRQAAIRTVKLEIVVPQAVPGQHDHRWQLKPRGTLGWKLG